MQAKKSPAMVKKMFESGQISIVDPETRYRFSLTAKCPVDGEFADIARFEKAGHSLSRVVFHCSSCAKEFEVPKSEMLVV